MCESVFSCCFNPVFYNLGNKTLCSNFSYLWPTSLSCEYHILLISWFRVFPMFVCVTWHLVAEMQLCMLYAQWQHADITPTCCWFVTQSAQDTTGHSAKHDQFNLLSCYRCTSAPKPKKGKVGEHFGELCLSWLCASLQAVLYFLVAALMTSSATIPATAPTTAPTGPATTAPTAIPVAAATPLLIPSLAVFDTWDTLRADARASHSLAEVIFAHFLDTKINFENRNKQCDAHRVAQRDSTFS